ncbi:hypothetical protein HOO68_01555 [Candidatus Gracilibacteria bacterium]|nr:hypothetical protein [Candidatus Gracilibacteria bacterium]
MTTATLSTYSREQLSDILRILKLYKTSLVQIGHRARLIDPKNNPDVSVRIEYPTGAALEDIRSFAVAGLDQFFGIKKIPEDVVFAEVPSLIGGIRIFAGDDMINISFQKFANQIKNT